MASSPYKKVTGLQWKGLSHDGRDRWRLRARVADVTLDEFFTGPVAAAKDALEELKVKARRGELTNAEPETVAELLARYIEHRVAIGKLRQGKPANTYRGYMQNHVIGFVPPAIRGRKSLPLGRMQVTAVRPKQLQAMLDAMGEKGLAASSIRQTKVIVSGAFKMAVVEGDITVNPCAGLTIPAVKRRELVTPDRAALNRLIAATEPEYVVAFKIAAGTGMRRGEIAALRWSEVDLDAPTPYVDVVATLQMVNSELRRLSPKSERSTRKVPLPPTLVAELRRHRTEQRVRQVKLGPAWSTEGYVIDDGRGGPLDPDRLTGAFERARKAAGMPGVRLHDLRHAYATNAHAKGVDMMIVAQVLGHYSSDFTWRTYVDPDLETAAPAAAAAEAALTEVIGGSS